MAKTRCPKCGYTEDDGRPHDRAVYPELCVRCAPPEAVGSRHVDVLVTDAPHLLAPSLEPSNHDA